MKRDNSNLSKAKQNKNDEFYTQLTDIENELWHYRNQLNGKKVYCNCDDPNSSNFWLYFMLQFNMLNLQELTATCYREGSKGIKWKIRRVPGIENIRDLRLPEGQVYIEKTELEGDGDFRSPECIEELENCDVVITNPPFSLFREFVDTVLVQHNKDLLIIGNMNAITYKEIFPLLKDNRLWLGYNSVHSFIEPNGNIKKFGNILWFSTLDTTIRHEDLIVNVLYKKYYDNPEEYPKYDNYDAINVDKTSDIPIDYYGVMGVPITYLGKHNPDQFEIVSFRKDEDGNELVFTRERERDFNNNFVSVYDLDSRDDKKCRRQNQWEAYLCENNNQANIEPIDYFYRMVCNLKNGMINNQTINGKKGYCRMLIKRKYKNDGTVNQ